MKKSGRGSLTWRAFVESAAAACEADGARDITTITGHEFSKTMLGQVVDWEGKVDATQRTNRSAATLYVAMPEIRIALTGGGECLADGVVLALTAACDKKFGIAFWRSKVGKPVRFRASFPSKQGLFPSVDFMWLEARGKKTCHITPSLLDAEAELLEGKAAPASKR